MSTGPNVDGKLFSSRKRYQSTEMLPRVENSQLRLFQAEALASEENIKKDADQLKRNDGHLLKDLNKIENAFKEGAQYGLGYGIVAHWHKKSYADFIRAVAADSAKSIIGVGFRECIFGLIKNLSVPAKCVIAAYTVYVTSKNIPKHGVLKASYKTAARMGCYSLLSPVFMGAADAYFDGRRDEHDAEIILGQTATPKL